jgi:hypothetical protein
VLAVAGGLAVGFGVGFAWLDGPPPLIGASLPTRTLTFAFQSNSGAVRHLGRGWSETEPWGVWSVGPQAELSIPIRERVEGDVTISIEARAYLVPSRADDQLVIVEANGAEVARLQYAGRDSQRATRVISVPKAVAARGSPMRITFKISTPRSPAELGVGRDTRALGIGLQTLTLTFPSNEVYVE